MAGGAAEPCWWPSCLGRSRARQSRCCWRRRRARRPGANSGRRPVEGRDKARSGAAGPRFHAQASARASRPAFERGKEAFEQARGAEGDGVNDWSACVPRRDRVAPPGDGGVASRSAIFGARAAQRIEQMLGRFEADLKQPQVLEQGHARFGGAREDVCAWDRRSSASTRCSGPVAADRRDERGHPARGRDAGARGRGAVRGGAGHVAALRGVAGGSRRSAADGCRRGRRALHRVSVGSGRCESLEAALKRERRRCW